YGQFVSFFGALSQVQPGLSPSWSKAALHGLTRQSTTAIGAVMERFMSNIESVHPLLSKDAVRGEQQQVIYTRNVFDSKNLPRQCCEPSG
ncbi:unnamed protein product, partial [Ectocarpus sp. 12 AP-2014]